MTRSLQSLKAFVASRGRAPKYAPRPGVVAVGAGKGGVGTSTVAALLAVEAARRGEQVLLVDADEGAGSLHLLFGIGMLQQPADLPSDGTELAALMLPVAPNLLLLPVWANAGPQHADLTDQRVLLRRAASVFDRFSLVVIDGGSRLASVTAAAGLGVERLLCVTGPDRIALASSYALLKVMRARFEPLPLELVVNGVDDQRGRGLHAVVRTATQTFLGTDVTLGGTVPIDDLLISFVEGGTSLSVMSPAASATSAVAGIVDRFLAERGTLADRSIVDFGMLHVPGDLRA